MPVFGESIYGFERRFAACTRYEGLAPFRRATGLLNVTPGSVQAKFERLAMLAGQDAADFDSMRWTVREGVRRRGSVVSLLGHLIRGWHLRPERLRFCPTCLAEDGPPEQRIHYQAWQILQVCACPRHRTLLVENCDECGEPLEQSRKTKPWACACGRSMTEMATTEAPNGAIAVSLAIMRILQSGPKLSDEPNSDLDPLPEPFGKLDLEALLTVLSKIGALATEPPEKDLPVGPKEKLYSRLLINYEISCEESAGVMDAAHRIICDWPKAMEAVFSSIAGRNPNPHQHHPVHSMFATRAGYRLLGRITSVDGAVINVIDDAFENWLLRERGIYIDGRQRPKVGVGGDVAIDVADALRRLEGRVGHPLGISAWAAAGAVEMVGQKVSLTSVDATVGAIAKLECSDFEDGMSAEDWSTRFLLNEHYRRSDAIRDILSGRIRVRRVPGTARAGLASLRICCVDFHLRACESATSAKILNRSPARRVERAQQADGFCRSGQLQKLLTELWPGQQIPDMTKQTNVRCKTSVRRYYGRDMKQRLYSIVDAVDLMEAHYASRA
ncbi:MAG: hypothetical protein JWL96_2428 [Sphingomonas bacterium]|uniref:TniQ family protein n=1 Tax=Sphingomonas bacterium TaxID=1895847 RepID=UPI0026120803|nr:TniQ family protein [Sphingomonas bacterium]MDB5710358.1 hypothetical protein [Sphingomonas bacterium]